MAVWRLRIVFVDKDFVTKRTILTRTYKPRTYYAQLLRTLQQSRTKAIIIRSVPEINTASAREKSASGTTVTKLQRAQHSPVRKKLTYSVISRSGFQMSVSRNGDGGCAAVTVSSLDEYMKSEWYDHISSEMI